MFGLWFADAVACGLAKTGDGSGWKVDGRVELGCDGDCTGVRFVSSGVSRIFAKLADSGSSRLSMWWSDVPLPSCALGVVALPLELDDGSFMSDAGVAGDGLPWR